MSRLRELLSKATPGPWNCYDDSDSTGRQEIVATGVTVARCYAGNPKGNEDSKLIVTLVNAAEEIADLMDKVKGFAATETDEDLSALLLSYIALDKKLGGG